MRRALVGVTAASLILGVCSITSLSGVATASPQTANPPGEALVAKATCDPVGTAASYRGAVPSPREVLGYRIGSQQATNAEIGRYWSAVDRASDRVLTGVYGRSWEGRPLRYALVGRPGTLDRLPAIRKDLERLRDPATSEAAAERIIERTPPILWVGANAHGDEPSGADAVVQLVYDLADRSDCVARAILDHAIVGLIPVMNPDGRHHDARYNGYSFDLNRDVLVGTQPEVSSRLELLRKYPPQLFVDEHENSGRTTFFPPNSDPIYHETPRGLYREIEQLYGPANEASFQAKGWSYETSDSGYDFFAQVYGDTVPSTQLGAVGMTIEQGGSIPFAGRVKRQFTVAITSVFTGATHSTKVLRTWRDVFVRAQEQGERCELQENRIYNPGQDLLRPVPDRPVCGYFLLGDSRATRRVVSRLQTASVVVHQLAQPTVVEDFRPYGDEPRTKTLPEGTYWISLAQPQKHWIQATLNEDTYVPFPYFYDVSGWSLPLLAGVEGGSTGQPVTAAVTPAPTLDDPRTPLPAGPLPRIAVIDQWPQLWNGYQYSGWLKWRLAEDWRFPYQVLLPDQVTAKALRDVDVLVVGNVDAGPVYRKLGAKGRSAIASWVDGGGRYVGWQYGARLARRLGISDVGMTWPVAESPGALMRIRTPQGRTMIAWDSDYNVVLDPGSARVVGAFPQRMFVSGFGADLDTLAGTAVQTVETVGRGSVVVFAYEPNFRAVADGSARLLRKAIMGRSTGSLP